MDAIKNRVEVTMMTAKTLYEKIETLYHTLDAVLVPELLDHPALDREVQDLYYSVECWLEENKPNETEEEAREILERM